MWQFTTSRIRFSIYFTLCLVFLRQSHALECQKLNLELDEEPDWKSVFLDFVQIEYDQSALPSKNGAELSIPISNIIYTGRVNDVDGNSYPFLTPSTVNQDNYLLISFNNKKKNDREEFNCTVKLKNNVNTKIFLANSSSEPLLLGHIKKAAETCARFKLCSAIEVPQKQAMNGLNSMIDIGIAFAMKNLVQKMVGKCIDFHQSEGVYVECLMLPTLPKVSRKSEFDFRLIDKTTFEIKGTLSLSFEIQINNLNATVNAKVLHPTVVIKKLPIIVDNLLISLRLQGRFVNETYVINLEDLEEKNIEDAVKLTYGNIETTSWYFKPALNGITTLLDKGIFTKKLLSFIFVSLRNVIKNVVKDLQIADLVAIDAEQLKNLLH